MKNKIIILLILILASNFSRADSSGFSITTQLGRVNSKIDSEFVDFVVDDFEDNSLFVSVSAGYQLNQFFSVDVGYFGIYGPSFLFVEDSIGVESSFVSVSGSIPLGRIVFISGEVGRAKWEADVKPDIASGTDHGEGYDDFTRFGIGLKLSDDYQLSLIRFDMKTEFIDHTAYGLSLKHVF